MLIKLQEAWLASKSQDPNKVRTRHNSVNSKIGSKMTPVTPFVDRTTEARGHPSRVRMQGRRHGIMPVGTLLTRIGL